MCGCILAATLLSHSVSSALEMLTVSVFFLVVVVAPRFAQGLALGREADLRLVPHGAAQLDLECSARPLVEFDRDGVCAVVWA